MCLCVYVFMCCDVNTIRNRLYSFDPNLAKSKSNMFLFPVYKKDLTDYRYALYFIFHQVSVKSFRQELVDLGEWFRSI